MTLQQLAPYLIASLSLLGPLGSLLEAIGAGFKKPGLVAFGQKLEAAFADLPEIFTGEKAKALQQTGRSIRPAPPVGPLACLALAALMLLGCGGSTPQAKGALAANEARLGYSAAAVVVTELAKLDADWMASLTEPDAAKAALPTAQKIGAGLDAATASLKVVRTYLTNGGDEAKARVELTNALTTSEDLLELLAEVGKKPPPAVLDAVGYLHGFLFGGGS